MKRGVEQALARDQALKNSSVSVQSVNEGVVLLAGKANTVSDHLRAIEAPRRERRGAFGAPRARRGPRRAPKGVARLVTDVSASTAD